MKYFLYFPLNLLCMALCYLTNWLVVFFADEEGELHGWLHMWQTWDSTLDNENYVKNDCYAWMRYNYDAYYAENRIWMPEYGREKRVAMKKKDLPMKDRIKRHLCRTFWLYRNCGYGFAFYWFGIWTKGNEIRYLIDKEHSYLAYETGHSLWDTPWVYKNDTPTKYGFKWKHYLGWKISKEPEERLSMLANRVAFKKPK